MLKGSSFISGSGHLKNIISKRIDTKSRACQEVILLGGEILKEVVHDLIEDSIFETPKFEPGFGLEGGLVELAEKELVLADDLAPLESFDVNAFIFQIDFPLGYEMSSQNENKMISLLSPNSTL